MNTEQFFGILVPVIAFLGFFFKEMRSWRVEIKEEIAGMRKEIQTVQKGIREEIQTVQKGIREEIQTIREETQSIREETRQQALRSDKLYEHFMQQQEEFNRKFYSLLERKPV